jgi:transposase
MAQSTQYVGIDLHQDQVALAVLAEDAPACEPVQVLLNEPARLRRFFQRVAKKGPVRACYEAGACGYVLQRALSDWGVACEVIAPSLIPKRAGDRVKTDRRDAEKLARLYRAGELTAIRIPPAHEERARALVRLRGSLTREILASRHYVLKLLQGRGQRFRDGKNWSQAFWTWLRQVRLEGEDVLTLTLYVELLEHKLALRQRVDERLLEVAEDPAWRDAVGRLRCLRGVDTLSALTLVLELGDARRFATARQLMSFVGLHVAEYSSGGCERRGGISKAGNAHCRRVLVEAAWHYRHPPRLGRLLAGRQAGQPEPVRSHAMRAQRRLYARYQHLERRMASSKAVTAVARELTGFVWALLRGEEPLLATRPPRT